MKIILKKSFLFVGLGLLILLAMVWGFKAFKSKAISEFIAKSAPTSTQVEAKPVKKIFWEPQFDVIGSARASQGVDIAPEVPGRVTKIYFKSGDLVKAGDPLVQLNPDVLQAQLKNNIASYEFSKLSYERQLALYQQQAGQKSLVDEKQAEMDEGKASIEQTQAQLSQLLIRAPFSGVLGLRNVDLGQYVSPGQVLVNLQSTTSMEVDFSVPEVMLSKLSIGLPVTVNALPYPDKHFSGKIMAVDSQISETSRTLLVRAKVENPDHLLLPQMFVNVVVHLKGGADVVVAPQTAISYSQIGDYVYVVEDGKAVKRYVTLGERRDDYVSILKGLSAGEILVTRGSLKLRDGAAVTILTDEKAKTNS